MTPGSPSPFIDPNPDGAPAPKPFEHKVLRQSDEIFELRTVMVIAAVSAVSLIAGLIFSVFSGDDADGSAGANTFSRSSIGHRALVEVLEGLDMEVVVSRFRSSEKAGPGVPLVVAEPLRLEDDLESVKDADLDASDLDDDSDHEPTPGMKPPSAEENAKRDLLSTAYGLQRMVDGAERRGASVVIVLPKWSGVAGEKGWIESANLLSPADAEDVIDVATGQACYVDRPQGGGAFHSRMGNGALPTIAEPQLITDCDLEPLVWNDAGVLVGRAQDTNIYFVADPDLLNTYGLAHGQNALVVSDLFQGELQAEGVVIDEILHGFGRVPSLFRELFSMPLLTITLHTLGLLGLAVAAAMVRFGKPAKLPPRIPPGKRALIESTAQLLEGGRHHAESARHYVRLVLRRTAAEASLPPAGDEETAAALATLASSRGLTTDVAALTQGADALPMGPKASARALEIAARAHRFRQEMKHGHP